MTPKADRTQFTPSSTTEFVKRIHGSRSIPLGLALNGTKNGLPSAMHRQNQLVDIIVSSSIELIVREALRGNLNVPNEDMINFLTQNHFINLNVVGLTPQDKQNITNAFNNPEDNEKTIDDIIKRMKSSSSLGTAASLANDQAIQEYTSFSQDFTRAWDQYEADLFYWRRYGSEMPEPPYIENDKYKQQPVDPRIQAFHTAVEEITLNSQHLNPIAINDPGAKLKVSAVSKLRERFHEDGEDENLNAAFLKDLNRITVSLASEELVTQFNKILEARTKEIAPDIKFPFRAENWEITKTGYVDRKTYIALPVPNHASAKGIVAEVKLELTPIQKAYTVSHHLYDLTKDLEDKTGAFKGQLNTQKFYPQDSAREEFARARKARDAFNKQFQKTKTNFSKAVSQYFTENKYAIKSDGLTTNPKSLEELHKEILQLHQTMYSDAITQCPFGFKKNYLDMASRLEGEMNKGKQYGDATWQRILQPSTIQHIINSDASLTHYSYAHNASGHTSTTALRQK